MKTTVCEEDTAEGRLQKRVVLFPFVEGDIPLALDDLIYIETCRHKNLFYTKNGVFSIYRKLNEIEMELNGMGFLRIHQSFLVNLRYVKQIHAADLICEPDFTVPISVRKRSEFIREYSHYLQRQVRMD